MNEWQAFIKGKKITVMGLGLLGRSLGDVKFLADHGAELIVTDLKSPEDLATSIEQLQNYSNIKFVLGEHRLEDFQNRDFILKAAGVPLDSIYIAEAREHNIPIEMSTSLFAAFTPATLVGITGTRGKSTVTHLVYEILKLAYQDTETTVYLGGNVRGVSTLQYLATTKKGDIAVLELDSWQLQGFGERRLSPHIAVFTTFMEDHLNYYKNNLDLYFADKANIFINQKPDDTLIISQQIAHSQYFKKYTEDIKSKVIIADTTSIPVGTTIPLPGAHNRMNTELAAAVAQQLGVQSNIIKTGIELFPGVPGRLQKVGEYNGVIYYNDTNATTPDATTAALQSLGISKNIILIMGGFDKNISNEKLLSTIPSTVKHLVLLPGTGTDRIQADLKNLDVGITNVNDMKEAVSEAKNNASPGNIVLLSPGFASFGLFKNEYDRGDQYDEAVAEQNNIKTNGTLQKS